MKFKLKHYILEEDERVLAYLEYWLSGGEFIINSLLRNNGIRNKEELYYGADISSFPAQHLFFFS